MDLPVPCLLAQYYTRRLLLELVLLSSSRRYLTVLDPLGGTDVQSEIPSQQQSRPSLSSVLRDRRSFLPA